MTISKQPMLPSVVDLKSSSHFFTDGLQSWLSAQNSSIVFYTFHEWENNNWLFCRESNRSDLFFYILKEYTTQPAARFIFQWSDFKLKVTAPGNAFASRSQLLKSCSKVPLSTQKSQLVLFNLPSKKFFYCENVVVYCVDSTLGSFLRYCILYDCMVAIQNNQHKSKCTNSTKNTKT